MKNSAFAVNPCPRDLLGKQWLFMHMSAHYRKMWSAQSVVDSAAPASLKAKSATPRSARRPHSAVDYSEGPRLPKGPKGQAAGPAPRTAVPKPASAGAASSLSSAASAHQATPRHAATPRTPTTPRRSSTLFSKAVRLSQKPSRADTDPGPGGGGGPGGHPRSRPGARDVLDGRASSATASRRQQLEYGGSVLRKPASLARHRRRDQEPSTYFDKLNQLVPDHRPGPGPGHGAGLRTSGQFLSEVFTARVPHRPQVLRTEVPSRLRFSTTYCPPRAKPVHSKPGVQGQEIGSDAARPMWTASSPPVSSRDSAYNGGISSGGESRGPTPDQAGTKKHSRKTEKKGKKKADPKRPYSADTKIRKKVENKLMKKLLEEERNELHEQRLRVDPWHGTNQDNHGDEILRNIDNLHIEGHVDDSLTEHESPVDTGSLSGHSVEEDMAEEVDESVEADSTKGADGEDSVIKDESVAESEDSVPSQSISKSSSKSTKQQIATQTDPPVSSRSQQSSSPTNSVSVSTEQSSSSHSAAETSSHPTNKSSSFESRRDMKTSQMENEVQEKDGSASHSDAEGSSIKHDKLEKKMSVVNNRINDMSYARWINMITKDVLEKRVLTYKALKAICDEHIEANCDKLDKERMQQEVDKLQIQLEISRDDYTDSVNNAADTPKREKMPFTSEFIPSLVEVDKFSILSGPLEVHHKSNNRTKPSMTDEVSHRSTRWQAAKCFAGALDSPRQSIVLTDEDPLFQHGNLKLDRLQNNIFCRNLTNEELSKTLSPPQIELLESVPPVLNDILRPSLQNDPPMRFTPQNYAAQILKDISSKKCEQLSDVEDFHISSKKSSTPGIHGEGNESFKFPASPLLRNYEHLNYLAAPAKDPPATLNETKEEITVDSTRSVAPTSDQFVSFMKNWLDNSPTLSFKEKFTGITSGHLNDKSANLNTEIENCIREIEKEQGHMGTHTEEVTMSEIEIQDEPQVVQLFLRHNADSKEKEVGGLEKFRGIHDASSRVTNTIEEYTSGVEDGQTTSVEENAHSQPVNKEEVENVQLATKYSSHIAEEQKSKTDDENHSLSQQSKLQSYSLMRDSSSIPMGTGQNSDILTLKQGELLS